MNFQELICIYLSWVGLPLPANFQPKQPMDHGCGSFPEDMVLLLDTWVSVPQLLYHKIFPKMYWFSCAEPGTTSLRPFKVLSSNLCINLPGWIPMSLISFSSDSQGWGYSMRTQVLSGVDVVLYAKFQPRSQTLWPPIAHKHTIKHPCRQSPLLNRFLCLYAFEQVESNC